MIRTRTFIENRWYRRVDATHYVQEPAADDTQPIDQQINAWLDATQCVLVNAGQIGMHTAWHGTKDDPYQLKCITIATIVMYQEPNDAGQ